MAEPVAGGGAATPRRDSGFDLQDLPETVLRFLTVRHLSTLTTLLPDGSPHVVPVGFTFDPATSTARVITSGGSVKVRNARRPGARAALCQVDGGRWLTLSGPVEVLDDPASVADAERAYTQRYRVPKVNPQRVVLLMHVHKLMGRAPDPEG
jgi:PPOX class probable F420-dependent enzyme